MQGRLNAYYTNWGFGRLPRLARAARSSAQIIPTGDLEGCQDTLVVECLNKPIIPTGDLEGCQDWYYLDDSGAMIIPTGDLEGCQGSLLRS